MDKLNGNYSYYEKSSFHYDFKEILLFCNFFLSLKIFTSEIFNIIIISETGNFKIPASFIQMRVAIII